MVCKKENGELKERCPAMEDYINLEANARQKGLCLVVTTNIQTGDSKVKGVSYKKSSKDVGCFLNMCPWCGQDIKPE